MVRNVKRHVDEGESIREACKQLNIIPKQYREWARNTTIMKKHSPRAKSVCHGPKWTLQAIDEQLLRFVFELREQGMAVSISMIAVKACVLSRSFREKTGRTTSSKCGYR
jgi:transposase-like protein